MDPKSITTTRSLLDALDARPADLEGRKAFDEAIWAARGAEAAILVTDLSGFTKQTKRHGIVHFLHVFRRCEVACMPIIERFSGTMMKQEADDLIAIFPGPIEAVQAAIQMQVVTQALNRSLPEADDHVRMCIGVESGPLLKLDDDAFGDTVNVAFKLGEDVADPGEILLGPNAYAAAVAAEQIDMSQYVVDGPREVVTGNVGLEHWSLRVERD